MKKLCQLSILAVGVFAGTLVWAEHHETKKEAGWFEAEACEFCRLMGANPELMSSMKFETHKINAGMLTMIMLPEKHQKTFDALWAKMHKKGEQLTASGESVDMCGCCASFDRLKQAGAKDEEVKTAFGKILLLTAKDPATVKMIHRHVERTLEEEKKMMAKSVK